jgi:hypothetical protein
MKIETVQILRGAQCVLTEHRIDPGEKCYWVQGVGCFRQDLTPEDIQEYLDETRELTDRELAEGMACELEAALLELKRRGADVEIDTEAFQQYRSKYPRQDS